MDLEQVSDDFKLFKGEKRHYGFVYVLHCKGKFKIGHTKGDVKKRVGGMTTGNPFDIDIVLVIGYRSLQGAKLAEKGLHERYSHKRLKGEWFSLSWWDIRTLAYRNRELTVTNNINSLNIETKTFYIDFQRTENKGPKNIILSGNEQYEYPMFENIATIRGQHSGLLSKTDVHLLAMKINEYLANMKGEIKR